MPHICYESHPRLSKGSKAKLFGLWNFTKGTSAPPWMTDCAFELQDFGVLRWFRLLQCSSWEAVGTGLQNVELTMSDFIVMFPRHCIKAFDPTRRDLPWSQRPFGGKVVSFSGDFEKSFPVFEGGSRVEIVHACVETYPSFQQSPTFAVKENKQLTALRVDPNEDAQHFHFPYSFLIIREGLLHVTKKSESFSLFQLLSAQKSEASVYWFSEALRGAIRWTTGLPTEPFYQQKIRKLNRLTELLEHTFWATWDCSQTQTLGK